MLVLGLMTPSPQTQTVGLKGKPQPCRWGHLRFSISRRFHLLFCNNSEFFHIGTPRDLRFLESFFLLGLTLVHFNATISQSKARGVLTKRQIFFHSWLAKDRLSISFSSFWTDSSMFALSTWDIPGWCPSCIGYRWSDLLRLGLPR